MIKIEPMTLRHISHMVREHGCKTNVAMYFGDNFTCFDSNGVIITIGGIDIHRDLDGNYLGEGWSFFAPGLGKHPERHAIIRVYKKTMMEIIRRRNLTLVITTFPDIFWKWGEFLGYKINGDRIGDMLIGRIYHE